MSDIKNPDYLSRLPPELVDDIFHHAHDSSQSLTTPLSKTLLPFQRRQLFRSITVSSYKSLENLCKFAESSPYIPSYVRYFKFDIEMDNGTMWHAKEAEDPGTPSDIVIEGFLRQLSTAKSVEINGSTRIVILFLSSIVTPLYLLKSLDITSTLHSLPDPFDPLHYTGLQGCAELKFFTLSVFRSSQDIVSSPRPHLSSKIFGANLSEVQLIGPLTACATSVRQLLSHSASVSAVNLCDTSDSFSLLYDLLDAIPAPEKVRTLSLGCLPQQDMKIKGNFLEHVKALTSLRNLSLMSDFASVNSNLYSDLPTLPITILRLAVIAEVSLTQLTTFISGPNKHSTLIRISLDHITGRIGTRIGEVGKPFYDVEEERWDIYPDWNLPEWTQEFSEEGLIELLDLAKKEGIKVEGSAVDAIGIMAEQDKDWELLEEFESDGEEGEEERK